MQKKLNVLSDSKADEQIDKDEEDAKPLKKVISFSHALDLINLLQVYQQFSKV